MFVLTLQFDVPILQFAVLHGQAFVLRGDCARLLLCNL